MSDLLLNPRIGRCQASTQRRLWLPAQLLANEMFAGVAPAYAQRSGDVFDPYLFPSYVHDDLVKLVDGDHLFRADIHRTCKSDSISRRIPSTHSSTIRKKRACLPSPQSSISPPSGSRRSYGRAPRETSPCHHTTYLAGQNIVEVCDPHLHADVAVVGEVEPLAEQPHPAVLTVWRGRVADSFEYFELSGSIWLYSG